MFKEPVPNKVMTGHVIRRESVPNEGSCRVKCYMEPNCVSINMGPLKEGKLDCELNNATAENEFVLDLTTKDAHIYLAIEVSAFVCMKLILDTQSLQRPRPVTGLTFSSQEYRT